jgi:hypothetical protein
VGAGGARRWFTGASGTEAARGTGGRGGGGCGGAKETGGAGFATASAVDEEAGQAAGQQHVDRVGGAWMSAPPPNRARLDTDVAARYHRATLREAVVHNPDVTLKISTTLEGRPEVVPPPNRARLDTDVAASEDRATLREAVVHNPDVTLKISTTLPEVLPPPNRARLDTDVAASEDRATLREAVVHNPDVRR